MKLSENTLLKKLKLSEKFPRDMLYAKKSALGVGLMKPSTILAVLALQLYVGHQRMQDPTSIMIQLIIDNESIQLGYTDNIMNVEEQYKIEATTWCDEVAEVLISREIKIVNDNSEILIQTKNKSIMDYAVTYIKEQKLDPKLIAPINHVRNYKKMYLLCELVGINGTRRIYQFNNVESTSCFAWKIPFLTMPKPSKKSKNIWSAFVEWLSTKDIVTINDFDYQMKCKYHMTRDGIFLRQNVPEVWCFKRV